MMFGADGDKTKLKRFYWLNIYFYCCYKTRYNSMNKSFSLKYSVRFVPTIGFNKGSLHFS